MADLEDNRPVHNRQDDDNQESNSFFNNLAIENATPVISRVRHSHHEHITEDRTKSTPAMQLLAC